MPQLSDVDAGETHLEIPVQEVIAYEFDDFRIDLHQHRLLRSGESQNLTHKTFQVLLLLVRKAERIVEKEELYKALWADSFVEDANLTQHIYVLRKTLGRNPSGDAYIETVIRTGYRFSAPVKVVFSPTLVRARNIDAESAMVSHLQLVEPHSPASTLERAEAVGANRSPFSDAALRTGAIVTSVLLAFAMALMIFWPATIRKPKSILVLPLKHIGPEAENSKIGLGMADSIITRLTNLQQVTVRPTSSVVGFTDEEVVDSLAIGRKIGVDTVLEGTVQRDGGRVRVSVQLLDVETGKAIWSDNFDENYLDIFNLQDSISKRVVRALHVSLTTQQEQSIAKRSTTNTEAFQHFQLGMYYHASRSKESLLKAEEHFKQSITLDPNYARGHAMLADTYNMLRYYRFGDIQELRDKGLIAANKAIELDSEEPDAYVALAHLAGRAGRARAKELLEAALSLAPNNSTARVRYGWVLTLENLDEASEQMRLATEYDPLSATAHGAYCNVSILQKKFEEAIKACQRAVEIAPESPSVRILLADAYFFNGRTNEAIQQINKRIDETRDLEQLSAMGTLAFYYVKTGRKAEADRITSDLEIAAKHYPSLYLDLMILAYARGERGVGYEYFLEAYDQRIVQEPMLKSHPTYESVWNDPRVREKWNARLPPSA